MGPSENEGIHEGLASVTWIGITIQASTVFGFVLTAKRAGPGVL
jgi:hypothetical protein